jgi:hypothetical protein
MSVKLTTETFTKKAIEVHGDYYDYSEVNYVNATTKIKIICKVDGHPPFMQSPNAHTNLKQGCPNCFGGVKKVCNPPENKIIKEGQESSLCKNHKKKFSQYEGNHTYCDGCPSCEDEGENNKNEKEIIDLIQNNYAGEIRVTNGNVFGHTEIEIFLPELKFEINYYKTYWQIESISGRGKQSKKLKAAEENGHRLIQIFEHDWSVKKEIIKSRILNYIIPGEKIFARKTEIITLNNRDKNNFLSDNHMQGMDVSSIYFGLKYEDRLVACMTFGKSRYDKNYDYELIRYCSIKGTNVIGGASRLLSHFRESHKGSVLSYADRKWSNGNLYKQLGFQFDGNTDQSYFYYNIKNKTIHHRMNFQKHKMTTMPFYAKDLSEYEIMKFNGYDRVWAVGNSRWILK